MLKRILLCALALTLILAPIGCNKQPEEPRPSPDTPENEQNGDIKEPTASLYDGNYFGDGLTWKLYTDGKLVIDGEGAFPTFETASEGNTDLPWANYVGSILRVEIGSGPGRQTAPSLLRSWCRCG